MYRWLYLVLNVGGARPTGRVPSTMSARYAMV